MYRARPFVITRYAVPNGRGQRRLQPSQEEGAAGSSHCTKIYRHWRLLIVEESKKKKGVGMLKFLRDSQYPTITRARLLLRPGLGISLLLTRKT